MKDAIEAVFSAWSEPDAKARRDLVTPWVAETVYYVDPHTPAPFSGLDGLVDFLQSFTDNMPNASARVIAVDGHHDHYRAIIDFMNGDALMVRGQYFVRADKDGRIDQMVGFIGTGEPA